MYVGGCKEEHDDLPQQKWILKHVEEMDSVLMAALFTLFKKSLGYHIIYIFKHHYIISR